MVLKSRAEMASPRSRSDVRVEVDEWQSLRDSRGVMGHARKLFGW